MSELFKEEIFQEIGKIIANFTLYECDDCVRAIMQWFTENGIPGKIIKLKTKHNEDFIISERLESQGITEAVTINGTHYGVEVLGLVFDNISLTGMTLEDWQKDFHSPSEEFIIEYIDRL